jgi:hypothetical protein
MNRKQRREAARNTKSAANEELESKMALFGELSDECLTCEKPFDKKDKEMAMTWNVIVHDEDTVRLYCPECWDKAIKITEDFKRRLEEKFGEMEE